MAQEHKCCIVSEGKGSDPFFRLVSMDKDIAPVFVWKGVVCEAFAIFQGCLPRHNRAVPGCTSPQLSSALGYRHSGYVCGVSWSWSCSSLLSGNLLKNENRLDLI